jgi:hypothetical protein
LSELNLSSTFLKIDVSIIARLNIKVADFIVIRIRIKTTILIMT